MTFDLDSKFGQSSISDRFLVSMLIGCVCSRLPQCVRQAQHVFAVFVHVIQLSYYLTTRSITVVSVQSK